jgi:hypothetical protein
MPRGSVDSSEPTKASSNRGPFFGDSELANPVPSGGAVVGTRRSRSRGRLSRGDRKGGLRRGRVKKPLPTRRGVSAAQAFDVVRLDRFACRPLGQRLVAGARPFSRQFHHALLCLLFDVPEESLRPPDQLASSRWSSGLYLEPRSLSADQPLISARELNRLIATASAGRSMALNRSRNQVSIGCLTICTRPVRWLLWRLYGR